MAQHSPPSVPRRGLEVDAGVRAFDLYSKRDLCIKVVSQEGNVRPRSCAVTTSNENDFFHLFNPQPKLSGENEPVVNVPHNPPLKVTPCKSIFSPSWYWQG